MNARIAGHWKAEVAKRIEVFATALSHRMKVADINALDLSYTRRWPAPGVAVPIGGKGMDSRTAQQHRMNKGDRPTR